jgi:hypothetical protein
MTPTSPAASSSTPLASALWRRSRAARDGWRGADCCRPGACRRCAESRWRAVRPLCRVHVGAGARGARPLYAPPARDRPAGRAGSRLGPARRTRVSRPQYGPEHRSPCRPLGVAIRAGSRAGRLADGEPPLRARLTHAREVDPPLATDGALALTQTPSAHGTSDKPLCPRPRRLGIPCAALLHRAGLLEGLLGPTGASDVSQVAVVEQDDTARLDRLRADRASGILVRSLARHALGAYARRAPGTAVVSRT